jgi:two-component system OmpR family sensor kinase
VSLLQASTTYRTALREADKMFDFHLEEVARSVHGGVPLVPGGEQTRVLGAGVGAGRQRDLPLQRRAAAGAGGAGLSDTRVNGLRLRIYTLQTPENTIQIAQDLDAREARARHAGGQRGAAGAALAPLLMLACGWVISRSLAPLTRMRKQVAERQADRLVAADERRACRRRCSRWWPESTCCSAACATPAGPAALRGRCGARTALAADGVEAAGAGGLSGPVTSGARRAVSRHGGGHRARDCGWSEQCWCWRGRRASQATDAAGAGGPGRGWRVKWCRMLLPGRRPAQDLGLPQRTDAAVRAPREALRLALRNLVDNAIKYTPEGR